MESFGDGLLGKDHGKNTNIKNTFGKDIEIKLIGIFLALIT